MKIEIRTKEITTKDGTKFIAYKGFTKKGWTDLKFTKEVENAPTKCGVIEVDVKDVNVNQKGRFPVIWVKKVLSFEETKFEQNVADYFD